MDEQNAKKLLDQTFNNDFDVNRFSIFIKELFNKFEISPVSLQVRSDYKGYIDSYQRIGNYTDESKKAIDVLVVKLNKESIYKDRARTKQRNLIAKYLDINRKDAALVAFYGDDPQDWRFSFVKMEYQLAKDGSISKDLTPAKRSSFLVGVNEPNHTCRQQFLNLVKEEEKNPSLEDIEESFGIENVTREFFSDYNELFQKLKESLINVIEKNQYVKKEFDDKSISTVDFSKKLLGQIVFIYFLQKKGWLGVSKNPETGKFKEWGSGPKNFLRKLFDKKIVPYDNFFNDILEPLFYEALASERDDDYYSRFNCKIPFLNGGLFEPINDYDWKASGILLENSIFGSIFETFDRFNFTVKEDEPLDKEVAVDPEMLGKVFENLLEVIDRKSKGAFYTPREIVHYMCQQSLINYLGTNTGIPINDIETFIQYGDLAQQLTSKSDVDEKYLPIPIKENSNRINTLLKNIKIVDPAVGSGAFPMGMMNEIVKARSNLSWLSHEEKPNNYDLKRETIENCLYGVDIDSSAVDIAKLRFWLSLIVDESDMTKIKPLPNLDHKIMCGNSLLEEFEGVKLFDEKLLEEIPVVDSSQMEEIKKEMDELHQELGEIYTGKKKDNGRKAEIEKELKKLERKKREFSSMVKEETQQYTIDQVLQHKIKESHRKLVELRRLHKDFFNAESKKNKKELTDKIDRIEWELIVETLKEEGNETAVQKLAQYKKNKSKPFFLWKLYFSEVFQRENPGFDVVIANPPYGADISVKDMRYIEKQFKDNVNTNSAAIFIDFGKNYWLNKKGTLSFIVPKSLLYSEKWFKLVESMVGYVSNLIDVEKAFEKVKLEQVVFVYNRSLPNDYYMARKFLDNRFLFSTKILNTIPLKLKAWVCGVTSDELRIYTNLKIDYIELSKISITKRGVGLQKFLSDTGDIPVIGGINIFQYGITGNKGYLSNECVKNNSNKILFMSQPKIISQDIIAHIQNPFPHIKIASFYDDKGKYIGLDTVQNTIIINKNFDYNYVLALLNSKFISWYTYKFIYCSAIRTMHFDNSYIGKIIIPNISIKYQEPLITISNQILSLTNSPDYLDSPEKQASVKTLEKEIDQLIYKLYDLTYEKIAIVENFNKGKQQ